MLLKRDVVLAMWDNAPVLAHLPRVLPNIRSWLVSLLEFTSKSAPEHFDLAKKTGRSLRPDAAQFASIKFFR